MANKKAAKKPGDKKSEDKPKVNFDEIILQNLSAPKLSLDNSGYHFTELDLSVRYA